MFFKRCALQICSKHIGKHPCRSLISVKLNSTFIEITLLHEGLLVEIFYSTCLPCFSIQICVLFTIILTVLRITPEFYLSFSNSTWIRLCRSCIVRGGVTKLFNFKQPQMKKSQSVISGDPGGHSTLWYNVATRLTNIAWGLCLTNLKRCARVPSWNQYER